MRTGLTLMELLAKLQHQHGTKRDCIAESQALTMTPDAKRIEIPTMGEFWVNDHAASQLAERLDIPLRHYRRLEAKHPDLLAHQVNALMRRENTRGMVRILEGKIRAFLSDKYRALDNYDLADVVVPLLKEAGAQVVSCEVTETRLYIKARLPWLDREMPVPEGLKMGVGHNWYVRSVTGMITISNSDVGAGMLSIAPGIFEKQCTNLAVFKDEGFGRVHLGKKAGGEGQVEEYLSDETKKLEDAVVWAKVRDVVKATMDGRVIDRLVVKMQEARGDLIKADPAKVVEVFAKKFGVTEQERGGLLRHLTDSGEMNRYGLQWGVTRLAGDTEDYDRASELERLGGQVIELPKTDWAALIKAAAAKEPATV